jgi:hypothetical protein
MASRTANRFASQQSAHATHANWEIQRHLLVSRLTDSQSWFCSVVGIAGDEFWHTVGTLFCSWIWFRGRTGMLSFTSEKPVS